MVALNLCVLPRIVFFGEGGKWNGGEGRIRLNLDSFYKRQTYLHLVAIDRMALPFFAQDNKNHLVCTCSDVGVQL